MGCRMLDLKLACKCELFLRNQPLLPLHLIDIGPTIRISDDCQLVDLHVSSRAMPAEALPKFSVGNLLALSSVIESVHGSV